MRNSFKFSNIYKNKKINRLVLITQNGLYLWSCDEKRYSIKIKSKPTSPDRFYQKLDNNNILWYLDFLKILVIKIKSPKRNNEHENGN